MKRTSAHAFALSIMVAGGACAAWSPVGFSVVANDNGDAVAFPGPKDSVYGLNVSAIYGRLDKVYGLCVAGIGMETEEVAGIGVAGICNATESAYEGALLVSGICNYIGKGGQGTEICGIANVAKDFEGLQVACVNWGGGSFSGAQIGAINIAGDAEARCDAACVQIGAFNIADKCRGVQIGAINSARALTGVQIGAANVVSGDFKGVQIGALNFLEGGSAAMLPVLRAAF